MDALNVFEELRFIVELLVAEQLFVWAFAKRKKNFWMKSSIGYALLIAIAVNYLQIQSWTEAFHSSFLTKSVSVSWYIFLVILSLIHIRMCYVITLSDALFMGIAGYSVQHIEYVVVNEVIARGIWKEVTNNLWLYILICIVTCALWYYLIARIFAAKLKACGGILYEDSIQTVLYFLVMLVVLFFTAFLGQDIFLSGTTDYSQVNYKGATYDFFSCTLVLVVQYSIFRISTLNREKEIVKQLLHERQKQYRLSKENIEMINHKCHDLKHQIQALKEAKSEELERYIEEVEESIMIYDTVVKTENEVLNTILSEKSLYCEKHRIRLSCIVDANQLDFMSTLDIYALLGNAIDNAIECVIRQRDKEKRVISLTISANGSFLCIQTNNYYEGNLQIVDGIPVTTKKNWDFHGFGMKSMKHLAEKYGGTLYTSLENGIFMLQIVIPIPAEFTRLLKEAETGKR
ncbi:ATP-binding protein [Anaerobium acetethylicum]|uniref:GHKL domain-containing protein n=1 Tax=Anaerobium acetethylicum TaxID=1619234 RepID=A0A1D3TWQ3_9FIRM|nr:ATP-binding protein [Anaerobium acetethylicum]SCP98674.1 GHKL domain-containing protein [Anaerobium acetethylicum]